MLRIEQHDADRIETVRLAQAVHHDAQQLSKFLGTQQQQFARLHALHDRLVVRGLGRQFCETLP